MKKYLIETMPDHLRGSHRAARNWGVYPANGAERSIVDECGLPADDAEYDHVVREATARDVERYGAPAVRRRPNENVMPARTIGPQLKRDETGRVVYAEQAPAVALAPSNAPAKANSTKGRD